jgi:hypothetical protein
LPATKVTLITDGIQFGRLRVKQPGEILLLACEVLEIVSNCFIAVVFGNAMDLL